jgi:hypothetical protein
LELLLLDCRFHLLAASLPVMAKFQQKLSLMAAVSQMLDLSRQVMPMCSRHGPSPCWFGRLKGTFLALKMALSGLSTTFFYEDLLTFQRVVLVRPDLWIIEQQP